MNIRARDFADMSAEQLHDEIKKFIITTLDLEDVGVADIGSEDALFGGGLGLDSVDALELGVALQKSYGIRLDPKDDSMRLHFASVRSLAELVAAQRAA